MALHLKLDHLGHILTEEMLENSFPPKDYCQKVTGLVNISREIIQVLLSLYTQIMTFLQIVVTNIILCMDDHPLEWCHLMDVGLGHLLRII